MENCDRLINNRNIYEPIRCLNLLLDSWPVPWSLRGEKLPMYKADFSSVTTETTIKELKKTFHKQKQWKEDWILSWCLKQLLYRRGKIFRAIESYECADLNKPLDRVFCAYSCRITSNKNKQGDNFEPKSLKVMTTALRGTKDNGYTCPTCEPGFEYTPWFPC